MVKKILCDFSGVIVNGNGYNQQLLDFFREIKPDVSLNIFTMSSLSKRPEVKKRLENIFDDIYEAAELGLPKQNQSSYLTIADILEVNPEEMVFIDDLKSNIEAAKTAGLKTILFENNQSAIKQLKELINFSASR